MSLPHLARFLLTFFEWVSGSFHSAADYRRDRAERERARVRPFRGGFRVGKCQRIALGWWSLGHQVGADLSPGRREVIGLGRVGWWVGSLVRGGWLVVRAVLNSLVSVGYGGATSPEVEPTRRQSLTVRYGESRRHRRQTARGYGEQTLRC